MLTRRHMIGALGAIPVAATLPAAAASRNVIDTRVNLALDRMWKDMPETQELSQRARAILVMPDVVKAGFVFGGAYGEGAFRLNDPVNGYTTSDAHYTVAAASFGFQVGIQTTSHALFFMTDDAAQRFRRARGWEIGADAEVTFPEAGLNLTTNSRLLTQPIIGVVFGQDGFLVGASLEGAKYSRIAE